MATLSFSLDEVPFSMRGSWLSVSRIVGLHTRSELVHLVSHVTGMHPVLAFQPLDGTIALDAVPSASPERLRWQTAAGFIDVAFADVDTVRVRGAGLALKLTDAAAALTSFTGSYLYTSPLDGSAVLTSYETGRRYRISRVAGDFAIIGAELLGRGERGVLMGNDGGTWEISIQEVASEPARTALLESFDEIV